MNVELSSYLETEAARLEFPPYAPVSPRILTVSIRSNRAALPDIYPRS